MNFRLTSQTSGFLMSLGGNISHNLRWVGVVDFVAGRVFLWVLAMAMNLRFWIYDLRFEIGHNTSNSGARASARFTAYLPPGTWLSGTLYLKNNVTLYLAAGSTLLGSANPQDYPENIAKIRSYTDTYVKQSLIAGENLRNVAIRGRGTIDGQGAKFRLRGNGYHVALI